MSDLTEDQEAIKSQFVDEMGYWTEGYDASLRTDPVFFDRFRELAAASYDRGVLEPRVRELLLLAVNVAVSHLSKDGIRIHMRNAVERGATAEEIRQLITLASGQGIHAVTAGVPILLEAADVDGEGDLTGDALAAREHFEAERGYWSDFWDALARLDPDFLDAYTDLSAHSRQEGPLDEVTIEFVAIAEDAAATHLYREGLSVHVENAIEAGASVEEVLEVLELVSVIGLQSFAASGTALEELVAAGDLERPATGE